LADVGGGTGSNEVPVETVVDFQPSSSRFITK
jgi:hypothetical protein